MITPNGKKLVIVESPAKAKTINKILGKDFQVAASIGHIIDLPRSRLGVDVENGYKPHYTIIKGKNKVVKDLVEAARKASGVLLATDPDREGEAIAYHIASKIKTVNPEIQRIEFNEITRQAVLRALESPRQIDMNRVNAQVARRVMDRIVGYMVSPILWKSILRGLSAGRVQSVALRLICEREEEIEKFVPVEYWTIDANLETPAKEQFVARLFKIGKQNLDPNKFHIGSEAEAKQHLTRLEKAQYVVEDVIRQQIQKKPPAPFITSTLQQDAARRFRMTPARIMQIAQQLYEGIDLGDKGNVGLITYMRTDSTRISQEAISAVRNYIADSYGPKYLPEKANLYRSKKGAQDAHEAIRPTYLSKEFEPRKLKKYLSADQFKLYDLIWKRFIACQMKPAVADKTTVIVKANSEYYFRAIGEVIIFNGFMQVYREETEAETKDAEKNSPIPEKIQKKERLELLELVPEQHFTKPPARFTESTLVKTLDKLGIGRPSTYAQIISTLYQRKYVEKKDRSLSPTELGKTVNQLLVNHFPNIFNVKFTAEMENELDKIENNQASYKETLDEFYHPFKQTLEQVTGKISEIKKALQPQTDEICELCGRPMVLKWGKNGQFLACSGYPECKNTRPLEEPPEPEQVDEKCPQCGSPLVIKRGRFGEFLACSNYPKCKFTKPISTGVPCPEPDCDGELIQRQSRKGKIFYSCSNYPDCKFALWNRPVAIQCPSCHFPLMEEKMTKREGYFFQCPKCKTKIKPEEN